MDNILNIGSVINFLLITKSGRKENIRETQPNSFLKF